MPSQSRKSVIDNSMQWHGHIDKEHRTAGLALPKKDYYADDHSKKPPKLASIRHSESAGLHMISRYPPAAALS